MGFEIGGEAWFVAPESRRLDYKFQNSRDCEVEVGHGKASVFETLKDVGCL